MGENTSSVFIVSSTYIHTQYEAYWASAGNFGDMIINPKMLRDHYPDRLKYALEDLS